MNTRFYIWVTSDCNLACPYCIQKYTMLQNKGYEMSLEEVKHIVDSCKKRGIHFTEIELTGGEASLWAHLEEGYKLFSTICDSVTLATNGNNPERVLALGMKTWIVSASQATPAQMKKYQHVRHLLTVNSHKHKKMPTSPVQGVIPSVCCTRINPQGVPQIAIEYIRGKVYYCPDCFAHSEHVEMTPDLVCDFEGDFLTRFTNKTYDKEICKYCLGNQKIWNQL